MAGKKQKKQRLTKAQRHERELHERLRLAEEIAVQDEEVGAAVVTLAVWLFKRETGI